MTWKENANKLKYKIGKWICEFWAVYSNLWHVGCFLIQNNNFEEYYFTPMTDTMVLYFIKKGYNSLHYNFELEPTLKPTFLTKPKLDDVPAIIYVASLPLFHTPPPFQMLVV